jgi:hypothetical protein
MLDYVDNQIAVAVVKKNRGDRLYACEKPPSTAPPKPSRIMSRREHHMIARLMVLEEMAFVQ